MTLNLVSTETGPIRYTCTLVKYEGPNSYHSKHMANVKVFADKQMDVRTHGQAKNYMSPELSMRGHKKDKQVHL